MNRIRKEHNKNVITGDLCFLPVYIDKTKLLDINSILFDGYSEFKEISFQNEDKKSSASKSKVSAGTNMSIFNLGGQLEAENIYDNNSISTISLKRMQTSSSLLANTIKLLKSKGILKSEPFKSGEFLEIQGVFKNNSIIDFINQMMEMANLAQLAKKTNKKNNDNNDYTKINADLKKIKEILSSPSSNKIELVYEDEKLIYVIKVDPDNLYNNSINDIYNNELCFFGQVKGIYEMYKFFSDTPISKFNGSELNSFIDTLKAFANNGIYDINFEVMTDNKGKKVVELDVIAIYRKS